MQCENDYEVKRHFLDATSEKYKFYGYDLQFLFCASACNLRIFYSLWGEQKKAPLEPKKPLKEPNLSRELRNCFEEDFHFFFSFWAEMKVVDAGKDFE